MNAGSLMHACMGIQSAGFLSSRVAANGFHTYYTRTVTDGYYNLPVGRAVIGFSQNPVSGFIDPQ